MTGPGEIFASFARDVPARLRVLTRDLVIGSKRSQQRVPFDDPATPDLSAGKDAAEQ